MPVPGREANAGVVAGAVVGAVVLLALLVAFGFAALTWRWAKYRTGLELPAVILGVVEPAGSGGDDPRAI